MTVSETFDGWAAGRLLDPDDLPLRRRCNLGWWWLTRNGTQDQADRLAVRLLRPMQGVDNEDRMAAEEMGAVEQFQAQQR